MCRGLRLTFSSPPPLSLRPPSGILPSEAHLPTIRSFLPDLLARRIIREVTSPRPLFFSRLFVVTKKDGPFRLIIDLSILNKFLVLPTFRMESVLDIASGIVGPLWGCTVDLKDAYYHVPMAWFFHGYLAFQVDGRTYVFQFLPFGLAVAPWAFHRVIRPIKGFIHRQSIRFHTYLDDFLVLHPTLVGLRRVTSTILRLLSRLGITVNYKKSHLSPSQTVEFLGVVLHLDSGLLSLPWAKVLAISNLCQSTLSRSLRSRRQLESLLGLLNFAAPLVPLGRLRLRPLISWMTSHTSPSSRDLPVPLDPYFHSLLEVWQDPGFLSQSVPMSLPVPSLQLMTDASLSGWGGVLLPHRVSGLWPSSWAGMSINWLELQAIFLSLQHFLPFLKGQCVQVMSDNTTAVACLLHQGTLRSDSLMSLSQQILEFCQIHSILPIPKHLCGSLNVLADQESRLSPVQTEWSLDRETFEWLSSLAGPFQVDLFATRDNTQLPVFVSPYPDPMAVEVNALSLPWETWDFIYLFPPIPLLRLVVPRLCQFQGKGVLVAPYYAPSAWFPSLLDRCPDPVPLPVSHSLSQMTSEGKVFHSTPSVFSLHAWRL